MLLLVNECSNLAVKLQSKVASTRYSEVVLVQWSTVSGIKVGHVLLSLHVHNYKVCHSRYTYYLLECKLYRLTKKRVISCFSAKVMLLPTCAVDEATSLIGQ